MFTKVLIANRGEIACRIIRTLRKLGVASVAVYSDADVQSQHVILADEAVKIGPAPAAESYLRGNLIIEAAMATGAQAIHPGYGFLSENHEFAAMCDDAGIAFVGPTPDQMKAFGLKHTARELAMKAGVPMAPGSGLLESPEAALAAARKIGLPVMVKATAGGGGIGMRLCRAESELTEAFAAVQRLGKANFKHAGLYLEKYIENARHIEVQIFGDGKGHVAALGERDCSAQRRNQKVIEETPAPGVSDELRHQLFAAAVKLGKTVNYRSAGTVEFILDDDTGRFYFLEVNTRLQVEHGVTELVTGVDLVEWMLRVAAGEPPAALYAPPKPAGSAIQVRLYAEDPGKNFQPSPGVLTDVRFPTEARVDTWVVTGSEVSGFYDPLIAKIMVHAPSRPEAVGKLRSALGATRIAGIECNLEYLRTILDTTTFTEGRTTTRFLGTLAFAPWAIEVLKAGTQTTVQDSPGRLGYWAIGVPPSGPMDGLAFRIGNVLLANPEGAAGLELTVSGPTLRFNVDTIIAVCGADMRGTLDGVPVPLWMPVEVRAGMTLDFKAVQGPGARTYIAFAGGLDVPDYLGSKATFTLGKFGGHGGRALRAGDVLRVADDGRSVTQKEARREALLASYVPHPSLLPQYTSAWEVSVLYGPHGAPDFFTPEDIEMLFSTAWKVHHHSDRTGVRLIGPHPTWARADGGEAGLHPSNIHDNAYAVGTIDFTGNLPIILGPDGPSLGGFVCPATIIQADLWKLGQFKPGDTIRFKRVTQAVATTLEAMQDEEIHSLNPVIRNEPAVDIARRHSSARLQQHIYSGGFAVRNTIESPVLHSLPASANGPAVVYRQDGDKCLLVEYGPLQLDLNLRFRVHALMTHMQAHPLPGIINLTPGIRSLHIHFDSRELRLFRLMDALLAAEAALPDIEHTEVPTRIVHLPLSWDDPACQLAIEKYMQVVRKDAPWCPSNLEFIRRINGLGSIDDVKKIVFDASYMVLGLGDVYLGAPVATPVDPRHRLVTTKYNPARTWTAENSVGIGGAYLCVYGMEGPGGYQFVGRTCQMWNPYRQTTDFVDGKPWLLRFFDQIRFYPVTAQELLKIREDFPAGRYKLKIEHQTFRLRDYNQFLTDNRDSIGAFKSTQQAAFDAERRRWDELGLANFSSEPPDDAVGGTDVAVASGSEPVFADVPGNVWKVEAKVGDRVTAGQKLAILESMKTEIPVPSPIDGVVTEVFCREGRFVSAGQLMFGVKP
ncbi:urea carboxylase [Humisphaera borealis]|uniref:Urea carboxylase n=1 Tax=Humisphaera borealis TaxID=2807512 RepID=A0A7M2X141_9BACT|nr:urea carboxylase [Humisphaera borealis]QOV90831.1 urea carboxylase [Humisphaera borealis]